MPEFEKQMAILPRKRAEKLLEPTPLSIDGEEFLVEIRPIPAKNRIEAKPKLGKSNEVDIDYVGGKSI